MYTLFAQAVRTGRAPNPLPTFDTAVDLHRLLDTIRHASDERRMQSIAAHGAEVAAS